MVRVKRLMFIAVVVAVLDQGTKWLVIRFLDIGFGWSLIPGYLDLVHVRNRGAAFGILANQSTSWTVPFFYMASAVSLVLLLLYYLSLKKHQVVARTAVALMCGGAIGNLVDRILRGEVVDFVSVHIREEWADFLLFGHHFNFKLEWPAFNVADSSITVAVITLLVASLPTVSGTPRSGVRDS